VVSSSLPTSAPQDAPDDTVPTAVQPTVPPDLYISELNAEGELRLQVRFGQHCTPQHIAELIVRLPGAVPMPATLDVMSREIVDLVLPPGTAQAKYTALIGPYVDFARTLQKWGYQVHWRPSGEEQFIPMTPGTV